MVGIAVSWYSAVVVVMVLGLVVVRVVIARIMVVVDSTQPSSLHPPPTPLTPSGHGRLRRDGTGHDGIERDGAGRDRTNRTEELIPRRAVLDVLVFFYLCCNLYTPSVSNKRHSRPLAMHGFVRLPKSTFFGNALAFSAAGSVRAKPFADILFSEDVVGMNITQGSQD